MNQRRGRLESIVAIEFQDQPSTQNYLLTPLEGWKRTT